MTERGRHWLERALDAPARLLGRLPLPPSGHIAVRGLIGFARQIARSRQLGLGRGRLERDEPPARD